MMHNAKEYLTGKWPDGWVADLKPGRELWVREQHWNDDQLTEDCVLQSREISDTDFVLLDEDNETWILVDDSYSHLTDTAVLCVCRIKDETIVIPAYQVENYEGWVLDGHPTYDQILRDFLARNACY